MLSSTAYPVTCIHLPSFIHHVSSHFTCLCPPPNHSTYLHHQPFNIQLRELGACHRIMKLLPTYNQTSWCCTNCRNISRSTVLYELTFTEHTFWLDHTITWLPSVCYTHLISEVMPREWGLRSSDGRYLSEQTWLFELCITYHWFAYSPNTRSDAPWLGTEIFWYG